MKGFLNPHHTGLELAPDHEDVRRPGQKPFAEEPDDGA